MPRSVNSYQNPRDSLSNWVTLYQVPNTVVLPCPYLCQCVQRSCCLQAEPRGLLLSHMLYSPAYPYLITPEPRFPWRQPQSFPRRALPVISPADLSSWTCLYLWCNFLSLHQSLAILGMQQGPDCVLGCGYSFFQSSKPPSDIDAFLVHIACTGKARHKKSMMKWCSVLDVVVGRLADLNHID